MRRNAGGAVGNVVELISNISLADDQMENSDIRASDKKPQWKNIIPSHERLWIWQKANKLYLEICEICKILPQHERYNLRSQIERSSKSVKDNIAEANGSYYYEEKRKGFYTSRKEASETQNHLREMEQKKYIAATRSQDMIDEYEEVKRGINGMVRTIAQRKESAKRAGSKKL